jgi:hypothetical protein
MLLGRTLTVDPLATALSNLDTLSQRMHATLRAVQAQAIAHVRPVAA